MKGLRIAVTGLHRGDNPQPGAAIVADIRREWPDAYVVGLVYNAYESGIYAGDGPCACHVMPYPAAGLEAWLRRLAEIHARDPFDWLIPTLDSEISLLAGAMEQLGALGIQARLPDRKLLSRMSKTTLPELAAACGMQTPATAVARDLAGALDHAARIGYPVYLKGPFYDASLVARPEALAQAAIRILEDWGPPLIVQEPVAGTEFNVMGLGDGSGGSLGHCAVRKLIISDKGKGSGSVIVRDSRLDAMTAAFLRETSWPGPFELEFVRAGSDDGYRLIEINPRFPAWVGFPTMSGANYTAAWVEWMTTGGCRKLAPVEPGSFFLRHQVEVHGRLDRIADILQQSQALS
jgi:carbamoyl-phosphate synthase large subunit